MHLMEPRLNIILPIYMAEAYQLFGLAKHDWESPHHHGGRPLRIMTSSYHGSDFKILKCQT